MHKPADVVTSRKDPFGRQTVYDLLPSGLPRLESVGRLDRATTGLLLFSNDFQTSQALLNPENEISRVYQVVTNHPLPPHALTLLRQGLILTDGTLCLPVKVHPLAAPAPGRSYVFTLREGKHREVRRLVMHFGYRIRGLHRQQFGPISLVGMKPGQVRRLLDAEIQLLHQALPSRGKTIHRIRHTPDKKTHRPRSIIRKTQVGS